MKGRRMNNRRHKQEAPSSANQPVPGQLGYRQLNYHQLQRGWRRVSSGGTRRMVIVGVILVPILLFTVWRIVSQPSPRLTEVTRYAQNGKIASRVDSLLSQQAAHQQFSGSVLIAYRDQVILIKEYSMAY